VRDHEEYTQSLLTEQQKRTALAEACRKAASDLQLAALEVHCVMKEEGLFNAVVRNLNELVLSFGDSIE
jgi:hypothetical protein